MDARDQDIVVDVRRGKGQAAPSCPPLLRFGCRTQISTETVKQRTPCCVGVYRADYAIHHLLKSRFVQHLFAELVRQQSLDQRAPELAVVDILDGRQGLSRRDAGGDPLRGAASWSHRGSRLVPLLQTLP